MVAITVIFVVVGVVVIRPSIVAAIVVVAASASLLLISPSLLLSFLFLLFYFLLVGNPGMRREFFRGHGLSGGIVVFLKDQHFLRDRLDDVSHAPLLVFQIRINGCRNLLDGRVVEDSVGLGVVPGIPGNVPRRRVLLESCEIHVPGVADGVGVPVASNLAAVKAVSGLEIIVGCRPNGLGGGLLMLRKGLSRLLKLILLLDVEKFSVQPGLLLGGKIREFFRRHDARRECDGGIVDERRSR